MLVINNTPRKHMTRQFRITIAASALKASVATGWAASISEGFDTMGELSDWEPGITMNEALLTGIVRCLLEVPVGSEVEIISNNAYIIDGLGKCTCSSGVATDGASLMASPSLIKSYGSRSMLCYSASKPSKPRTKTMGWFISCSR